MQKPSLRGVWIFPGSTQFYDVEVKKLCSYSYIHPCNVNISKEILDLFCNVVVCFAVVVRLAKEGHGQFSFYYNFEALLFKDS